MLKEPTVKGLATGTAGALGGLLGILPYHIPQYQFLSYLILIEEVTQQHKKQVPRKMPENITVRLTLRLSGESVTGNSI